MLARFCCAVHTHVCVTDCWAKVQLCQAVYAAFLEAPTRAQVPPLFVSPHLRSMAAFFESIRARV